MPLKSFNWCCYRTLYIINVYQQLIEATIVLLLCDSSKWSSCSKDFWEGNNSWLHCKLCNSRVRIIGHVLKRVQFSRQLKACVFSLFHFLVVSYCSDHASWSASLRESTCLLLVAEFIKIKSELLGFQRHTQPVRCFWLAVLTHCCYPYQY